MDSLKIRNEAVEPAAASADGAPSGAATPPKGGSVAEAPASPSGADALEGPRSARLEELPPPTEGCFTTWRPGTSAPPRLEDVPPHAPPVPREEDFAVVAGPRAGLELAPAAAPAAIAVVRLDERPRPAADPLDDFFYRPDEEAPSLLAVGTPAETARPDDADVAAREEYLTFLLGQEEYAIAIERVREVLKAPPITEVPRAPAHVLGVVTVRGEVVAVLDPRRRLGLPGAPPEGGQGRVVIVDGGDGPCGMLVDSVSSVVRLRPGSIEAPPQGIGGSSAECLAGIGRQGDRLFTVLDLGAFLRRPAPRHGGGERHAGA